MERRLWCAVVLAAGIAVPVSPANAANFPGCPAWSHTLTFVNNCTGPVTIKETDSCFSNAVTSPPFNGSKCWPSVSGGSFTLAANGGTKVLTVPSCWSGNFGVASATCSIPIQTLAEMTFDGGLLDNPSGQPTKIDSLLDAYDISMVDGFTTTFEMKPDSSVKVGGGNCGTAGCTTQPVCPSDTLKCGDACLSPNQAAHKNSLGEADLEKYGCVCSSTQSVPCTTDPNQQKVVPAGCVGKYGCSPYIDPGKSNPGSACCPWYQDSTQDCSASSADRAWASWAQAYITAVKTSCPGQYAWQFDDKTNSFNCQGSGTGMSYTITTCPK